MKHTVIYIDGMTCINCQSRIWNVLKLRPEITGITVSYEYSRAEFDYDPKKIRMKEIVKMIEDLGYQVIPAEQFRRKQLRQAAAEIFAIALLFVILQRFGILNHLAPDSLAETGMGYGLEVDMIREAHKLDMLTCPYVFDPEQAKAMAEAGADILVAHMGLTTKGSIGAETAVTLDDCCTKIREIIAAGREVNPDIMVICHGGPIADPEDAEYVIKNVPEIDGFFGASSIERLASERGMTAQAAAFKAIQK